MQQRRGRRAFTIGLLSIGLFVAVALTVGPAQAATGNGPYYAEPAWDQKLPAATRFVVLLDWNSEAVLDRETGLVWEKAPDPAPRNWPASTAYCVNKLVGGRVGWRLPSVIELKSVQDPNPSGLQVPASVFTTVLESFYWSATTFAVNPTFAWIVGFGPGFGYSPVGDDKNDASIAAWCVRGGMNADQY